MASRPPQPPDAFLSYTRFDDQHDGGKITEFCKRLVNTVQAVTGASFRIFQDVGGIGLGQHWPGKLDEMLDETRFFIPVLTPSYFNSTGMPRRAAEVLARRGQAQAQRPRAADLLDGERHS